MRNKKRESAINGIVVALLFSAPILAIEDEGCSQQLQLITRDIQPDIFIEIRSEGLKRPIAILVKALEEFTPKIRQKRAIGDLSRKGKKRQKL